MEGYGRGRSLSAITLGVKLTAWNGGSIEAELWVLGATSFCYHLMSCFILKGLA